jgi:hypothetical protein
VAKELVDLVHTAVVALFSGWSKCEASCLNFDQGKKVVKMSRDILTRRYNVPAILTHPQNSPTTAVTVDDILLR